jgi:hypothetical protein
MWSPQGPGYWGVSFILTLARNIAKILKFKFSKKVNPKKEWRERKQGISNQQEIDCHQSYNFQHKILQNDRDDISKVVGEKDLNIELYVKSNSQDKKRVTNLSKTYIHTYVYIYYTYLYITYIYT